MKERNFVNKKNTIKIVLAMLLLAVVCLSMLFFVKFLTNISVGADNPEVLLKGNLEKYINFKISDEDKGTLIQYEIEAGIDQKEEFSPVKENELTISLNQIDGKYPHAVKVIAKSTEMTNGKVENIEESYQYDATTGIVIIKTSNVDKNGDLINSSKPRENAKDEYSLICYYDTYIEEAEERELNVKVALNASLFEGDTVIAQEREFKGTVSENVGELSSILYDTVDIANGYIKSNIINGTAYTTTYAETQNITISKKEAQEKIKILENNTFIKTIQNENGEEVTEDLGNNGNLVYKSTKIKREDITNLLGEDGVVEILDINETVIAKIDKDTQFQEDGTVVINYENEPEAIIIKTSEIKNEGIFKLENTKEMKSTMLEADAKIKTTSKFLGINEKVEVVNDEEIKTEIEIFTNNYENIINIKDAQTNVEMELNTSEWTNKQQNEITFDVYVNANSINDNMLKNPTIRIELPSEVEKVILGQSSVVYANGLELQEPYLETNENGNIVIAANLVGTQTQYDENTLGLVTDIKISATIILKKDIENTAENVNLTYTNQYTLDGETEVQAKTNEVQIESYKEENTSTTEDFNTTYTTATTNEATTEELEGLKLEVVPVRGDTTLLDGDTVYEGEFIKYNIKITNITKKPFYNIKILGAIPEGTTYGELEADYNHYMGEYKYNFDETFKNKIIQIGTLEAGETYSTFYEVKVNELQNQETEKDIITSIKTYVDETEVTTYDLVNKASKADVKVFLGAFLDNISDGWNYSLKVESEENKEVTVQIAFPEAFELLGRVQAGGLDNNGIPTYLETDSNNILTDTIETNKEYWYGGTMNSAIVRASHAEPPVTLTAIATVEVNEKVYRSNENRIEYEFHNVSVTMTSENEGEEVKYEDEINYEIVIKNIGKTNLIEENVDIISFNVMDYLPEEVDPVSLQYEYWEENEDGNGWIKKEKILDINSEATDTEGNKLPNVDLTLNIPYKETINIKIKTTAEFVFEKTKIENSATVTGDTINTKISNVISHTILPYDFVEEDEIEDGIEDETNDETNDGTEDGKDDGINNETDDKDSASNQKNSIKGIAWIDKNKDGERQESEKKLSNIDVMLVDAKNSNIISNEIKTDSNGEYKISNLEAGKYIVLFKYDTETYRLTEYQKSGVFSGLNSDVSKKEVNLQGQKLIVGATDIISLEASISNIDIGLIENEICDLKLDKYISKISVTTSKGTQQYSYNNAKLAKVEIKAKEIEGATVVIEYKIVITNEGELPTTVDKVIDYLPENMTFSSELNKSWGMQTKGQLVNTKTVNQRINAGESIELYLVLTKTMTGNSTGKVINIAEIGEISNSLGISDIDSTPANKTQGEDDYSQAEVIISVGTGGIVYVGIIIIIFVILVSILIVISKKGYIQAKYISKISKISIFIIIFSSLIWTGMDSVLSSSTDKITLAPSRLWFTWQSGSSHTNGYGSVCFWNSSKGWEAHCINAGWAAYNGWYNFSYATSLVNKVTDGTSPEITVNKVNYENGVDINTIGNYYMYGPLEFKATKKNSTEAINYDITAYDWEGQSKEVEVCDSEGSSKECKSEEAFYIKIPMNQITNGLAKITLTATLTGEKITTKTQSGYLVYSPPYGQNVKTTERHDVYELDTEQDVIVTDSVTWSTINVWLDVTKQDADNANIKLGNVEFYVKNGNGKYLQLLDENKDKLVCCTGEYEVDKYENMKWVVTQNDATTFKTENNGKFILKNLQGGIYYYIVEKDNPNYGYINDYTVTKAFNSNNKYGIIYVITLTNTKETGNLEIIKQDKEANRTLQGMSFKIKKTSVFKEDRADVNGEGGITISDVTDIQLYILYRIEFGMQPNGIGDVNNNGIINDKDIEYIQRHLLKQIEPFGLGDINTDGYINYEDKAYIEQYLIGGELSEEEKSRADINRDGYINDKDFKAIEQYLDVPGNARELSEEEKLRADVNQDKLIDQHDITIIDRYIETEKYNIQPHGIGDVNDDGVINTTDANLIQMRLAGYKTGICEYIIASDKNKTYTGEQKEVVGTISLTNMETTTNDNDATIFTTDENGKINILNMLKDDYYLEEISVGNNYYGYVVEDDYISYEYKGKTGNGNDIPFDISRQSSVETGASADSTVIKYSNILNVYNKQKYVKLSGYVWVDENSSKQSYRNDLYKTNEHPEIDGYEDDKDILKDGIKVRLKNKTTKELINETTTANGGKYLFIDVLIEELDNYYIEFEYDGLTYTNVVPHIDKDTGSKAAENATVRDDFNKNFSVIEGKSENTSITRDSYGNEKHTLTYNLDEKGYTATLINVEAEPIITSNTAEASYNIKDDFTYGQEEIENINLGLYERERPDIEILKDLYDVRVAVNGYTHIYEAGQAINHLTNNSNDAEAIFNAGIKFPSGKQTDYENISYRRAIYKADYECEVPGKELKVYATYVLKIRNTSTNLKVRVNEIMDYYHNAYTFEKIGTGINTKTRDLTGSVKKFTNDDNNKALSIELDTIISAQSMTEVYIQFSIPKDRLGDFLDEATDNGEKYKYVDNLENIAEINSYSVFDESGKIYAGIDKDSNPGNVDKEKLRKETRRKTEDDTSLAPGFRIEVRGTREIVGTVFLDESVFAENPNEIHTGETRNGNGIYDEAAERKISGVEVVLKNDNGEIAKIYDKETQKWKEAKANVDSNGNFSIKGFMPGEYMLTYKWGDNTYIVDNKSPINVKDYKGTIYLYPERAKEKDWYADEDNRYSDAMDNYETRKLIDAEDSTTNIMDSTTPTLGFGIEKGYSKEELLNKMGITEREGEIPTFTIPNVDFGITERARQLLDVEKTVDSVEILVGASTVAHGKLEKDDEGALKLSEDSSKYLTYIPPAGEQGNGMIKAEIDSELLHGAKAKIKYKISVVNNSEIDYDTKDYYLYGYPGQESEIINYKPIYVYDYLDKSLSYSEGGWNIQTLNGSGGIPGYNKTVGEKTVTEEYLHKNYLNLSDYSEEYVGYEDFKNKYKDAINNWTENNVNKAREKRLNGKTILQYNENIGIVNPGTESDDIGIIVEGELVNTQEIDLNNDVEITNVERQGETGRSIIPSSLYDRAESIVITSPTGENQNYILIIGVAISFLVTIGTGIVFIKKRVLR